LGKWQQVALAAGGVLALDQLSKLAVWLWLAPVRQIKIIPGLFDLTFYMNTGVAFGMMSGDRSLWRILVLTGAALAALGIIVVFIIKTRLQDRLFIIALSLVAGGAIGNVVDRVRMGAVIDFLDVYLGPHHWPAFNLADAGITVGTALIAIHFWRSR